jgi:ribosomal protein L30E
MFSCEESRKLSISPVDLEKQLKLVTKTGKYLVGRKEVLNSLKGTKLLVWSASANLPPRIFEEAKNLEVPAIRFDGNPIELGRTIGIPFKVSIMAVKSPGDASLGSFEKSQDYFLKSGIQTQREVASPSKAGSIVSVEKEKKKQTLNKSSSRKTKKDKGVVETPKSAGRNQKDQETNEKERTRRSPRKKKTEKGDQKAKTEEDSGTKEKD